MTRILLHIAVALLAFLPAGCEEEEEATLPPPQELSREAMGHYCGMIVADHPGPKAQIHLKRSESPVWFTSVRDAVVFTMLPEEPKTISAIYVTDMSKAESWESPGPGTWMDAHDAWYVVESSRMGGMGAPEAVPFSDEADANRFIAEFGGRLVRFGGITAEYVLSPVGAPAEHEGAAQ